jgi:hypothetical protein
VDEAMSTPESVTCGCAACQGTADHPERALHQQMNLLLSRLDEPQRRWYAAVEANRLGYGGVRRGAEMTGLDEQTIRRGQQEVAGALADVPIQRQRRPGGGRPRVEKGTPRS